MSKTTEQLVSDAIVNVLRELWYKDHPYCEPETYSSEFQRFCENKLHSLMNSSRKSKKEY